MKVSLIWAMSRNSVIGRDNGLPWRLPREMKHFMNTTRGHPVIMGRRTFESMDGKPLPKRVNIVVTTTPGYEAPGGVVTDSLEAALAEAERQCAHMGVDEAFVIGGAGIYGPALEVADRLYVTVVQADIEGDTFFPAVDWSRWQCSSEEAFPADDANPYPFTIAIYERGQH